MKLLTTFVTENGNTLGQRRNNGINKLRRIPKNWNTDHAASRYLEIPRRIVTMKKHMPHVVILVSNLIDEAPNCSRAAAAVNTGWQNHESGARRSLKDIIAYIAHHLTTYHTWNKQTTHMKLLIRKSISFSDLIYFYRYSNHWRKNMLSRSNWQSGLPNAVCRQRLDRLQNIAGKSGLLTCSENVLSSTSECLKRHLFPVMSYSV